MTCITNEAYVTAAGKQRTAIITQASVETAIQVALALWQRNSSKSIANMQDEMADLQMKLAEEVQAHAAQYYPKEAALVADAFSEVKLTTQYTALAAEWAGILNASSEAGRQAWLERMDDTCQAPTACEDARWQRNGQLATADMLSYAARQDESRTQILNDRRYARQLAVLGLGKGQLQALRGYQQIAMTSVGTTSSMLLETVESAMNLYGYRDVREHPQAGWGYKIQDTWGLAKPPSQQVNAPTYSNPRPEATTYALAPVPQATVVENLPRTGKEGESDDAPNLQLERLRGNL